MNIVYNILAIILGRKIAKRLYSKPAPVKERRLTGAPIVMVNDYETTAFIPHGNATKVIKRGRNSAGIPHEGFTWFETHEELNKAYPWEMVYPHTMPTGWTEPDEKTRNTSFFLAWERAAS